MTGEDADVLRGYLDVIRALEAKATGVSLTLGLEQAGFADSPTLCRAHERAVASVIAFVGVADRDAVELRRAITR